MGKQKKKSGGSGSVSPTDASPAALRSPEKKARTDGEGVPVEPMDATSPSAPSAPPLDVRCLQDLFDKFAIQVTEKLNQQMKEGMDKQNEKLDTLARKTTDLDQKLFEMDAKVTASNALAQQALQTATALKADASKAPSEASTEAPPPLSARLRAHFPAAPPPPTPRTAGTTRIDDCEKSPDNDGQTILIGGFPRDTERQIMQEFLTTKLGDTPGMLDIEPKYRLGSIALMRFRSPTQMWTFMRQRPKLQYESKDIFFTIPKSPSERSRDKKLNTMRAALQSFLPGTKTVTVSWMERTLLIDGKLVARYSAESGAMQLSAVQLKNAEVASSKTMIMEKYTAMLATTSATSASDVKDWS
jgi:hypothetical protein